VNTQSTNAVGDRRRSTKADLRSQYAPAHPPFRKSKITSKIAYQRLFPNQLVNALSVLPPLIAEETRRDSLIILKSGNAKKNDIPCTSIPPNKKNHPKPPNSQIKPLNLQASTQIPYPCSGNKNRRKYSRLEEYP